MDLALLPQADGDAQDAAEALRLKVLRCGDIGANGKPRPHIGAVVGGTSLQKAFVYGEGLGNDDGERRAVA